FTGPPWWLRPVTPLRRLDPERERVRHRVAAPAHAELAGDRGERHHRRRGASAVPVPLEPPSAPDQGGRGGDVEIRQPAEIRRIDARLGRRLVDGPRLRGGAN